ncbi:MAG: excinuclease ABC subunit UvrC, partial [Proteobacteria bacterium]|nr:excinuclease ABC subunit UvrC [Pseudomonadota bacterium]
VTRKRIPGDGACYIGPYSCQRLLYSSIEWVHKIFPLVRCSPYEFSHTKRPCNYYAMKRCLGPCHHQVDQNSYQSMVKEAIKVLRGDHKSLEKELTEKMQLASQRESYEEAASYRDQLFALQQLKNEDLSTYKKVQESDIVAWLFEENFIVFYVLHLRNYMITGSADYVTRRLLDEPVTNLVDQFLLQIYEHEIPPKKIIVLDLPDNHESVAQAISYFQANLSSQGGDNMGSKSKGSRVVTKLVKARLKEEKTLMSMAQKNAEFVLLNYLKEHHTTEMELKKVVEEIGYEIPLERVECIDVSHFQGSAIVASKVCFVNGIPEKNSYRKYNITLPHTANYLRCSDHLPQDDYAAIRQVMARRLSSFAKEKTRPQMIVIDGGKGQLSSAISVCRAVLGDNFKSPTILAIAKPRTVESSEGSMKTKHRLFASYDRIFSEQSKNPTILIPGSASHRFFTRLRDEAHRFAISHHRTTFKKHRHSSQLEHVKGIGPKTRKNLMAKFGSLDQISRASAKELRVVPGMTEKKIIHLQSLLKDLSIN